jgi:hypothetical protein
MLRLWLNSFLSVALCLTISQASGQDFAPGGGINYGYQANRLSAGTTLLGRGACATDISNTTTYSFTAATGSNATATGMIYIGIVGEDGTATFDVSSATINGVAAVELTDQGGTGIVDTAFYRSPSEMGGDTAAITVTFSEAITSAAVCLWKVGNIQSNTPVTAISDDDTASGALVLTLGAVNSGFGMGICTNSGVADATTWAVLTERTDTEHAEADYSTADGGSTGGSMSVTCDWTGTNDASGSAIMVR